MSRVTLQTLLDRSDRNMASGTHAVVRESALEMIRRAYAEGINVQISEGHRSYARQNALYAQGRTKPGNIVTNARGGQSWHNHGVAVDYFLTTNDGNTATWTVNNNWRRVAQIGKDLGFEWGGDWTSFVDYPHLQMTGGLSLADLQAGKKPKLTSKVNNKGSTPSKPAPKPAPTKSNWKKKEGDWTGSALQQWDYGNPVKQLQDLLAQNYFYPEKGAKNNGIDSYYGAKTKDAVERYQSVNGLTVDGIAGKATYNKLKGNEPASKPKPKPKKSKWTNKSGSWTGGVLKQWDRGTQVKQLQQKLAKKHYYPEKGTKNNGIDSYYGSNTKDAVKRFQTMNGLTVDGIAGKATYNKLS